MYLGNYNHGSTWMSLNKCGNQNSIYGSKISTIFNYPEMIDVKFIFDTAEEEKIVFGHKFILSLVSPVFRTMFFGKNHQPSTTIENDGDIRLVRMIGHNFDFMAFWSFLKFVYLDKIGPELFVGQTYSQIQGIFRCADFYEVAHLKENIFTCLCSKLTSRHTFLILET